jgi:hypothetical protein
MRIHSVILENANRETSQSNGTVILADGYFYNIFWRIFLMTQLYFAELLHINIFFQKYVSQASISCV